VSNRLKQKINSKKARIALIGLGYIGLPLAVAFAKAGYRVQGIDTDQDRVDQLNKKKSYILDVPSRALSSVVANKKLSAHTDFSLIKESDVAIFTSVLSP